MRVNSFILWRLGILIFTILSYFWLPYQKDFNRGGEFLTLKGIYQSSTNFDGEYYVKIAQQGYKDLYSEAFFPLYPLLIRFFSFNLLPEELVGIVISNVFIFLSLKIFVTLSKKIVGNLASNYALLALIAFPSAFYFVNIYTESLFLFLSLMCFWQLEEKKYFKAGLMCMLATACRLNGVFLFLAFLVKWIEEKRYLKLRTEDLVGIIIAPLGLLSYMTYLYEKFSDPFYFSTVQKYFGANRITENFVVFPQVVYRYLKMLVSLDVASPTYFVVTTEFLIAIMFLFLLLYSWKKIPTHYFVFYLFSYLTPTLTGTFSSMPRYVLVIFPAFMMIGLLIKKHQKFKYLYYIASIFWLFVLTSMFTRGYFVG